MLIKHNSIARLDHEKTILVDKIHALLSGVQ